MISKAGILRNKSSTFEFLLKARGKITAVQSLMALRATPVNEKGYRGLD